MADTDPMVAPFPFATLDELKERWPDFPTGADAHATVLLEDASQFILDVLPTAADAPERTRRRIVCAVVKRAMAAAEDLGVAQAQQTAGPYSGSYTPTNPHGDFYLTKPEKIALGEGRQAAYSIRIGRHPRSFHSPLCSLRMGGTRCSCGADIAGKPIYEAEP